MKIKNNIDRLEGLLRFFMGHVLRMGGGGV